MNGSRRYDLDLLKGFGIFIMVFNHVKFGEFCHQYIQSFHMPLFFIASGYLWREKAEGIGRRTLKKAKGLLLPYFFFGTILTLIWIPLNPEAGAEYTMEKWINLFLYPTQGVALGGPLWFLPCMFVTDFIFNLFMTKIKNKKIAGVLLCLLAIGGAIYASRDIVKMETDPSIVNPLPVLPFALEPALAALLFMLLGYLLKKHGQKLLDLPWWLLPILFVAAGKLAYINPTVDMRSARFCIIPLFFLNGFLQTICWWNFFRKLEKIEDGLLGTGRRFLVFLSTYSIVYLLLNRAYINQFYWVMRRNPYFALEDPMILSGRFIILVLVFSCIALTALLLTRTRLRVLIGR